MESLSAHAKLKLSHRRSHLGSDGSVDSDGLAAVLGDQ